MYKLKLYDYNKTIVFGHWHCSAFWHYKFPKKYNEFGESACFLPFVSKEIIALDTCTAYTKKVNVMILED